MPGVAAFAQRLITIFDHHMPKPRKSPKAKPKQQLPTSAPRVDGLALLRAGVRTGISAIPFVGKLVKAVGEAEAETRERRYQQWCAWLVEGESDESEFAASVEEVLAGDDGERVRAAVLESSKAAVEAVDASVIPAIARLTRRYLKTRTPDPRIYRWLLELLRLMDADVYAGLVEVMPRVVEAMRADAPSGRAILQTRCDEQDGAIRWHAYMHGGLSKSFSLLEGPLALRVASALMATPPQPFATIVETPSYPGPTFDQPTVDLLLSVLG